MPTTRGSSSSGTSTVDQTGGGQQPDPWMHVDPTKNVIDVDEDKDQTQAEPLFFLYVQSCPGGWAFSATLSLTRVLPRKSYNELRA